MCIRDSPQEGPNRPTSFILRRSWRILALLSSRLFDAQIGPRAPPGPLPDSPRRAQRAPGGPARPALRNPR
eukprot:5618135-Pyramimonas_sp.AAC.1